MQYYSVTISRTRGEAPAVLEVICCTVVQGSVAQSCKVMLQY